MNGRALFIALAAAGLTACGGGSSSTSSSGGAVVGLELPSNVSVVTAQGSQSAGGVMLKSAGGQTAIQVFFVRAGRNYGSRAFFPSHARDEDIAI